MSEFIMVTLAFIGGLVTSEFIVKLIYKRKR